MAQNVSDWVNTGLVSMAVGYLGYRSTRAGQKTQAKADEATAKVAAAAEKRAEVQQALDAQKSIAQQYQQLAEARAVELREARDRERALLDLVTRQVNDSAAQTEQAIQEGTRDVPPTTS